MELTLIEEITKDEFDADRKIYIAKQVGINYNLVGSFFIKKDNIEDFLRFSKYKAINYHYSKKLDSLPDTEWSYPVALKKLINEKIKSISGINLFAMIELIQKNSLILCFGDNHTWADRKTLETDKWKFLCGEDKEKKLIDYKDDNIIEDSVSIMDKLTTLDTNSNNDIFITYFILYILKNFRNVHFFIEKWNDHRKASYEGLHSTPLLYSKFIWSIFDACTKVNKCESAKSRDDIIAKLFNDTCKFHYNDLRGDNNSLYFFLKLLKLPFFLQKKISYKIDNDDKEYCIYKPYETADEDTNNIFLNKIKQLYILFFIQGYKITKEVIKQYITEEKIEARIDGSWKDEDKTPERFKYRYPKYKKMMEELKVRERRIFIFKRDYTDNIIGQFEFDHVGTELDDGTKEVFRMRNIDNYIFQLESRNLEGEWNTPPIRLRNNHNNYFNILHRLQIQVEGKKLVSLNNTNINDEYYYLDIIKDNYHKLVINKLEVTINLLEKDIIIPVFNTKNIKEHGKPNYNIEYDYDYDDIEGPFHLNKNAYDYCKEIIINLKDDEFSADKTYTYLLPTFITMVKKIDNNLYNIYSGGKNYHLKAIENITLKYDDGEDVFNLQIEDKNYKLKLLLLTDYIEDKEIYEIIKDYFPYYFDDSFDTVYQKGMIELNKKIEGIEQQVSTAEGIFNKKLLEIKLEKLKKIIKLGSISSSGYTLFKNIITNNALMGLSTNIKEKEKFISKYKDSGNVDGIHVTRSSKQLLKLNKKTQEKVITFLFDTLLPKFNNNISNQNKIIYYEENEFKIEYYIWTLFIDFYNICRILYYTNFGNRNFPYKTGNNPEYENREYENTVKNSICLNWGGENISAMHKVARARGHDGSSYVSQGNLRAITRFLYDEDSYGHNSAILIFMRNYLYNEEYNKEFLINLKNKKEDTTIIRYAVHDRERDYRKIFRFFPKKGEEGEEGEEEYIKIFKYAAENKHPGDNSDCVNIFDLTEY